MNLLLDKKLGAEDLQYAIFQAIYQNINTYLTAQQAAGQTIDSAFNALTGRAVTPIVLELFDSARIHYGHRPSMVEAPVTEYPSVAVSVFTVQPAPDQGADYGHNLRITARIEFIVKSGPYPQNDRAGLGEDIVGRRAQRTTEAMHALMDDYRSPGKLFLPPQNPPTAIFGEIFARDESSGTGNRWYWQAVRLEYVYGKQAVWDSDL